MKIRFAVAVAAAVLAMSAGVATAAPTNPHALAAHAAHHGKGFLALAIDGGAPVFLPPGKAVAAAQAACVGRAAATIPPLPVGSVIVAPADLTVDAVRLAFPAPVNVCTGVILTSQVAADAAEVEV